MYANVRSGLKSILVCFGSWKEMGHLVGAPFRSLLFWILLECWFSAAITSHLLVTYSKAAELCASYLAVIGCSLEVDEGVNAIET